MLIWILSQSRLMLIQSLVRPQTMGAECGSHKIGESTKHDKNSFGKVWGLVLEKQRNKGDTVDKRFDY